MDSFALSPPAPLTERGLPDRVTDTRSLLAILGFALALRIGAAAMFPSPHYPDETFQALEQAHRYAFGYGIKPWEFESGLRSTILPTLLAVVFKASDALGLPIVLAARIVLATFSLLPVVAIYRAGQRVSSIHAVIGGVAAATWCELVNFSFRPLTEALATSFILTALALMSFRGTDQPRRALMATGACLGAALMLRVQFAPALLVPVLCLGIWDHPRRLVELGLGAAIPVLIFGMADWIAWGAPFHAPLMAVYVNVIEKVSSTFGTSPPDAYLREALALYGPAIILVGAPLILRASTYRAWILTALTILVSHSLIPHKEYRFVFAATSILVVAAALASADLLAEWSTTWSRRARGAAACILGAIWIGASLLSASTPQQTQYRRAYDAEYAAFKELSRSDDLCGLLLDRIQWDVTSGYTTLRRDIPIYQWSPSQSAQRSQAYNYIFSPAPAAPSPGYEAVACFRGYRHGDVCLTKRPGACARDPALTPLTEERHLGDPRR